MVFLVVQYRLFRFGTRERRVKTCKKIYIVKGRDRGAYQDSIQDRYKQCMYIYVCIYVFTRSKREFFDYSALVPFMLIEVASYIIQRFYVIMGGSMVRVELLRGLNLDRMYRVVFLRMNK